MIISKVRLEEKRYIYKGKIESLSKLKQRHDKTHKASRPQVTTGRT